MDELEELESEFVSYLERNKELVTTARFKLVMISLASLFASKLTEPEIDGLTIAKNYWKSKSKTINVPEGLMGRCKSKMNSYLSSGEDESQDAWLNRMVYASLLKLDEDQSDFIELIFEFSSILNINIEIVRTVIQKEFRGFKEIALEV